MPEVARAGYRVVAPFGALGEKQAIVLGHDWGATAAYAAAALGPEVVRLLIAVAVPHPRAIKLTPRQVWAVRHFLLLRRKSAPAKLRANDLAYVDELWRRWSPTWKDIPPSETAAVKQAFSGPGPLSPA